MAHTEKQEAHLPRVCSGLQLREFIDLIVTQLPDWAADWKHLGRRHNFLGVDVHQGWAERVQTLTYGDLGQIDWPLTSMRYLALVELMLKAADTPGWDWLWAAYAAASLEDSLARKVRFHQGTGALSAGEEADQELLEPLLSCDRRGLEGESKKEGSDEPPPPSTPPTPA